MYHGCQKLSFDDMRKVSRFLEIVKTSHFHELTNDLVCDLKVEDVLVMLASFIVDSSVRGQTKAIPFWPS